MATKTKATPRLPAPVLDDEPNSGPWHTPPATMEEGLRRIEALGQRVSRWVQYMSKVANLPGTSPEAKAKAVALFYERMVILERQLSRIQEDLQLG
jgi:hypothetical protein